MTQLIITADDFGYADSVDAGIAEAAAEGLIDAVAVMVERELNLEAIKGTGVELGLHLELDEPGDAPRATDADRERAGAAIERQIATFVERVGREPAFINGHHHCHARPGLWVLVSDIATEHGAAVRSVSAKHRRLLRCRGISTPDVLIGRLNEGEPPDPGLGEVEGTDGVVEWMVHPGLEDADLDSAYAAGRVEDLDLLRLIEIPYEITRTSFFRQP